MISKSALENFKKTGIWYTGIPALSPHTHIAALRTFLARGEAYKSSYLQTKFHAGFEGYSYLGQQDSDNQYADDQLYTYVLSDYIAQVRHPTELLPIIAQRQELLQTIREIETSLLSAIAPNLLPFYREKIGHSLSANYYPVGQKTSLRLTEHPDGSLFTVFPFGMDEEFKWQDTNGKWYVIEKTNEIVCFSGYLLQCLTGMPALNHKVEKEGNQTERFSFAYFSVPRPQEVFSLQGKEITTEGYFKQYLSLFN